MDSDHYPALIQHLNFANESGEYDHITPQQIHNAIIDGSIYELLRQTETHIPIRVLRADNMIEQEMLQDWRNNQTQDPLTWRRGLALLIDCTARVMRQR